MDKKYGSAFLSFGYIINNEALCILGGISKRDMILVHDDGKKASLSCEILSASIDVSSKVKDMLLAFSDQAIITNGHTADFFRCVLNISFIKEILPKTNFFMTRFTIGNCWTVPTEAKFNIGGITTDISVHVFKDDFTKRVNAHGIEKVITDTREEIRRIENEYAKKQLECIISVTSEYFPIYFDSINHFSIQQYLQLQVIIGKNRKEGETDGQYFIPALNRTIGAGILISQDMEARKDQFAAVKALFPDMAVYLVPETSEDLLMMHDTSRFISQGKMYDLKYLPPFNKLCKGVVIKSGDINSVHFCPGKSSDIGQPVDTVTDSMQLIEDFVPVANEQTVYIIDRNGTELPDLPNNVFVIHSRHAAQNIMKTAHDRMINISKSGRVTFGFSPLIDPLRSIFCSKAGAICTDLSVQDRKEQFKRLRKMCPKIRVFLVDSVTDDYVTVDSTSIKTFDSRPYDSNDIYSERFTTDDSKTIAKSIEGNYDKQLIGNFPMRRNFHEDIVFLLDGEKLVRTLCGNSPVSFVLENRLSACERLMQRASGHCVNLHTSGCSMSDNATPNTKLLYEYIMVCKERMMKKCINVNNEYNDENVFIIDTTSGRKNRWDNFTSDKVILVTDMKKRKYIQDTYPSQCIIANMRTLKKLHGNETETTKMLYKQLLDMDDGYNDEHIFIIDTTNGKKNRWDNFISDKVILVNDRNKRKYIQDTFPSQCIIANMCTLKKLRGNETEATKMLYEQLLGTNS